MRENLVRMLECIEWLTVFRVEREVNLVPGSAVFRKDRHAELTFYNEDQDEGEPGGRGDWELPAVAQVFVTVLVYAHLWLCKSERDGDEVAIRGPRVLCPNTILGMLQEKRYLEWTTEEALDFVRSLPFQILERGEWNDSILVAEGTEHVQRFRAKMFLVGLLDTGVLETREQLRYMGDMLFSDMSTVTYQCLGTGLYQMGGEWQRPRPEFMLKAG